MGVTLAYHYIHSDTATSRGLATGHTPRRVSEHLYAIWYIQMTTKNTLSLLLDFPDFASATARSEMANSSASFMT